MNIKNIIISSLLAVISIAGYSMVQPLSAAFSDPFLSLQLSTTDLINGYILSTDGTENIWIENLPGLSSSLTEGYIFVGSPSNEATATSSVFVDGEGQVGIGTVSPSATLSVDGDLLVTENNGNHIGALQDSGGSATLYVFRSVGEGTPPTFSGTVAQFGSNASTGFDRGCVPLRRSW